MPAAKDVHFDVDDYLNRFIPSNPIRHLPKPVARFLGYRDVPAPEIGNILVALWAMTGAFFGLLVVGATFKYSSHLQSFHPPVLIASLGATAILDYNTIQSPLAQPRASLLGHSFSAIIGVAIAKLFMLSADFENIRWIAGPLACGVASFVMAMTNTVHPPGGATALLAAVDPTVAAMGWMFVPFILLGSGLMFGVAMLVNNVQRQFPVFWWTPKDVGMFWSKDKIRHNPDDAEKMIGLGGEERRRQSSGIKQTILLSANDIVLPIGFVLDYEQEQMLQILRDRLREWRSHEEGLAHEGSGAFSCNSEKTDMEPMPPGS